MVNVNCVLTLNVAHQFQITTEGKAQADLEETVENEEVGISTQE